MFGGVDATGSFLSDTWEWDGTNWTQSASPGPSARHHLALAHDPVRRRSVLFGGATIAGATAETWEYSQPNGADVTPFGSGCSGTLGVPFLGATSAPSIGNPGFSLFVSSVPAGTATFVGIGKVRTLNDLGGGCAVYLPSPMVILGASANGSGVASHPIPIPNFPGFVGEHVYVQSGVVDPNGAYLQLAAFTRGLDLTLGL